jgi:hypothetical protein
MAARQSAPPRKMRGSICALQLPDMKRCCGFLKRFTPLRSKGISIVATIKDSIQAWLRAIVIKRDGGCILRNVRYCNGLPDIPGVVLQADHLVTRSNSATFADSRLVVCLCRPCHAWKSLGGNQRKAQYDALVRTLLPADRVELWDRCEKDSWRPVRTRMTGSSRKRH